MRVDCQNLQELQEHVADLSHGDRLVLLTDKGALRFRINNNGIDFHESDEKGNLLMGDLKTCPDCGHSIYSHQAKCFQMVDVTKDNSSCPCTRTYESLVGEKAMTPDMKITFPPMIEGQTDWKVVGVGVDVDPELQLLVIDLGDSCVVKVEKGELDLPELDLTPADCHDEGYAKVAKCTFTELRSAIEQKPVPRIERDDIQISTHYECYRIYFNDVSYPLPLNVWDALCELVGKPLPIYSGDKWEDLQPNIGIGWEMPVGVWRFTR